MLRAILVLAVLGGVAAGVVLYLKRDRGPKRDAVPVFTIVQEKFVRQVTAEGNLRAVKATPLTVPQSQGDSGAVKVAWVATDGMPVKKGDVVVRFDPSDPEKALRNGTADLESANARLGAEQIQSRSAIDARDTAAVLATKELEQTRQYQSKDQQIFSRNQIIESEIDEQLAGARKDHAEKTKQIERNLSSSKTGLIAVEQNKAKLAIKNARTALESMEIRAPHDGLFVLQRDWRGETTRVGDQLWPGQAVGEIPLLETMEVEVFVLEVDGSGLNKDQPAEVTIEARPDTIYKGKIRLVDKLAKPRVRGVPIQYFAVVVELEKTDVIAMKPGQRVQAKLVLDQADALVVPRQAIVNKDGKNLVFRRTPRGEFESIAVELGAATSGRVVVKSGLVAGDAIALRDPTRSVDHAFGSADPGAPSTPAATGGGGK
ncbi:MAG: efflux RND transporter periplasmic adaptor subunit [Deltaproteobacteria bacterium]|nr:efflux RND transporter periplasmic adaptor subunit [Deltaproteobacteria bacterium]